MLHADVTLDRCFEPRSIVDIERQTIAQPRDRLEKGLLVREVALAAVR